MSKKHTEDRANDGQSTERRISRRDFVKVAGLTALASAAVGSGSLIDPSTAYAAEKTESPILNATIERLDKPPYLMAPFEGAEKLERFDGDQDAFANREFHQQHQQEHGNLVFQRMEMSARESIKSGKPGYTMKDHTLNDVGWVSYHVPELRSWEPLGDANLDRVDALGKWEGTPKENNRILKKAAALFGAGQTGIAERNKQWFYSQDGGKPIIFSNDHDKPEVTEDAKYIPEDMKTLIVMVVPMYEPLRKYIPTVLPEASVSRAYSLMAETVSKLAEFIRGLGYNAIPMGNDTGLSVPMAIDAGLGELGRHGRLVNPIYGSWLRICKVLTDMPATFDKPIKFGVAEFCMTCKKCAEHCPADALSMETEPSYDVACPSNNPGMKKWYCDAWACLEYWGEHGSGCTNCMAVCPYDKPQTWIHDLVKGVSAKTTAFNSMFVTMDTTLGYTKTTEKYNPEDWWTSETTERYVEG